MATITALDGAKIADAVYRFDPIVGEYKIYRDPETNQPVIYDDSTTDLQMALYTNGTTYVVAFRGTESVADWVTNGGIAASVWMDEMEPVFKIAGETLAQWIDEKGLSSSNTTIVGHSLGGALAQYFGATTEFDTLTYNPLGIGAKVEGTHNNVTNYITMHDIASYVAPNMVGQTYMLQDENLWDVTGHGITNFTDEREVA